MKRQKQPKGLDVIMNQPVHMMGFPDIIVTRGFAYQYYKNLGWDESDRGFDSLDYMIFSAPVAKYDLTDTPTRDFWLAKMEAHEAQRAQDRTVTA